MKQALTVLLALLLCFAVSISASAYEITGLDEDFGLRGYYEDGEFNGHGELSDFRYLTSVRPGTTYFIPLSRRDFEWEDDVSGPITLRSLQQLGVSLNLDYRRGDTLIRTIRLTEQGDEAGILIAFEPAMVSVDAEEFEVDIQVLVFDTAYEGCGFTLRGTVANRGIPVKAGDRECVLGRGRHAVGYDDVAGVRFQLGEGVSIVSSIAQNERYYGAASVADDDNTRAVLARYPQIEKALRLQTVGLKGSVEISSDKTLYIYDDTFAYLGTTGQQVPYRGTYYLSSGAL